MHSLHLDPNRADASVPHGFRQMAHGQMAHRLLSARRSGLNVVEKASSNLPLPGPYPGLMARLMNIHANGTSIQIHNYNVNNHGAI